MSVAGRAERALRKVATHRTLAIAGALLVALPTPSVSSPGLPPVACGILLAWARPGSDMQTRLSALTDLGRCPADPTARRLLLETILESPDPFRGRALDSLRPHLHADAHAPLLELVRRRHLPLTQQLRSLEYLSRILAPAQVAVATPVLVHVLRSTPATTDHARGRVIIFALAGLAAVRAREATPLVAQYTADRDVDVRVAAIETFADLVPGRPPPPPKIVLAVGRRALQSKSGAEAAAGARLLRSLASEASREVLVRHGKERQDGTVSAQWARLVRRASLFSAPSIRSERLAILPSEAIVYPTRGASSESGWLQVRLRGGRTGWVLLRFLDFGRGVESSLDMRHSGRDYALRE